MTSEDYSKDISKDINKLQIDALIEIFLRKRGAKSRNPSSRKAQKISPSSNPSSTQKHEIYGYEGLSSIDFESYPEVISLIYHNGSMPEHKVHDDKVKKSQMARWQAHRKKMKRQSRKYSSFNSEEKELCRRRENCTIGQSVSTVNSVESDASQSLNQSFISFLHQLGLHDLFFSHGTDNDKNKSRRKEHRRKKEHRTSRENSREDPPYYSMTNIISGVLKFKF